MNRASRLWAFLRRRRRQLAGAALALALLFVFVAGLFNIAAMAGQSDDPAAPAATIALFIAGFWFLQEYILRAMQMILRHPWFNRDFPDKEASP